MNREEAFNELVSRGVESVVIEFSGGNDEGGPDSVSLVHGDGTESSLSWSPLGNDDLYEALNEPLNQWGSFAGEFQVYGTIEWDVPNRKVYLTYQEEAMMPVDSADHKEV